MKFLELGSIDKLMIIIVMKVSVNEDLYKGILRSSSDCRIKVLYRII